MRKRDIAFLAVVASLGFTGLMYGFMVGLLNGAMGDWIPMGIFVTMASLGGWLVYMAIKSGRESLRRLKKIGPKGPEGVEVG